MAKVGTEDLNQWLRCVVNNHQATGYSTDTNVSHYDEGVKRVKGRAGDWGEAIDKGQKYRKLWPLRPQEW